MLKRISGLSILCVIACALAFNASAQAVETQALTPFTAKYKVSKGRLNLGSAKRQLSQIGENRFTFSYFSDLSLLILSDHRRETSELVVNQQQVKPLRYLFKREGTGSDKSTTLDFSNGQVLDVETDKKIEVASDIQWYDEVSYQLQLKLDLAAGKQEMIYYLVNHKKKDKLYHFKVVGEEVIEVPAGKIETVKLQRIRDDSSDRVTEFWLAPKLGYLLVRIRQERDGSEVADAQLEQYVFNPL
ncbi:DUF3108 domain-containing protein [Catenovulum agarivorans]|uniref:DUF3108 domain-containing protein n=1 Tax=Catenovulum agarivorans TaxID=1172192 RepID=UPI0003628965|nr:DUF3108 domain-containing protein [Catenovulum agarivorans]